MKPARGEPLKRAQKLIEDHFRDQWKVSNEETSTFDISFGKNPSASICTHYGTGRKVNTIRTIFKVVVPRNWFEAIKMFNSPSFCVSKFDNLHQDKHLLLSVKPLAPGKWAGLGDFSDGKVVRSACLFDSSSSLTARLYTFDWFALCFGGRWYFNRTSPRAAARFAFESVASALGATPK